MEESTENVATVDVDDSNSSFLESELEALQSIYLNELEIKSDDDKKNTCVLINLHPATADKQEEQYVKMTLKFSLNEDYPHTIPKISIHNPRGLSEEKINSTYQDLLSIAENKIGSSMLFEITEAAKEHLTAENRPCGECAICLYGFSESDVFTKTDCYHYFHSHCLARYAKDTAESKEKDENAKEDEAKELLCPMCRIPIQFSGTAESYPPPSTALEEDVVVAQEIMEVQKKMADLYQKQLEKGGIIDVEAEKNKYLLEISNVPTVSNAPEKSEAAAEETETPAKSEETTPQPQSEKPVQEPKHPKTDHIRPEDTSRPKNRNRQQGNQNNYPRSDRRQRGDWYNDHDDRDLNAESRNTGYTHSRPRDTAYRKDGPRRDRGSRNGFNRGNPRYPRANERPYYPNQRPRAHTDTRKSDENGQEGSPLSDSIPNKEVPTSKEEIPPSDSTRQRGDYERRGNNRGRGNSWGGPRGRGGYRGRNNNYEMHRNDFRERRNYNPRDSDRDCEGGEPRGESHKDSGPPPHGESGAAKADSSGTEAPSEGWDRTEEKKEDSDVLRGGGRYRGRGPRPYNNGKGFQGRGEYDDRRYQRYDNSQGGGYRRNQYNDRRGYQRGYGDRKRYQEDEGNRKTDDRQSSEPSPNIDLPRKAESDGVNGSQVKGFATNNVLFDSNRATRPPPGFNDPKKKVVYGPESFNAPPGFPRR